MQFLNNEYRDEIFEAAFENGYHCLVVVDRQGFITYMNKSYCNFLDVDQQKIVGMHVADVIENSRMHIVIDTGVEEIADLQYIRGNYMIANRIPVYSNGEIVGAIGTVLYRDTKEWMEMNSHIKNVMLELEYYRNQLKHQHGITYSLHDLIGKSSSIIEIKNKVKKVAPGDVTILLRGESGTGKELFAHSIHHLSERNSNPFVVVNCATIPEHLFEAELFGYHEGAFTGAKKGGKIGKIQLADGGTLFLDEIGDMPMSTQVKLLRVLQEGKVEALGGTESQKVDLRIVAATNQPLEKRMEENLFREDLFYRINVIPIHIPPLRERTEDIRLLSKYLLYKITRRSGKRVIDFQSDVLDFFMHYSWPGNIRELENLIESAVYLTNSEIITLSDLPEQMKQSSYVLSERRSLKDIVEETEKQTIEVTLQKVQGDKNKAKNMLGIGKSALYEKIKKYSL
ncbi:PAS domain S-box protein [Salicibibacter halophilus]|uniref:PAS domain S-box protein n=1 Tax=Salicibibacter halophilus TaxID=2502791 RepID=A0A514LHG7_9BACI|nr:sigma 54-interacting transcriptional regulator [Salicibibacter halophilus]QDI91290.1 PAS domain S-box protein [Salicibibacter halophilus]